VKLYLLIVETSKIRLICDHEMPDRPIADGIFKHKQLENGRKLSL